MSIHVVSVLTVFTFAGAQLRGALDFRLAPESNQVPGMSTTIKDDDVKTKTGLIFLVKTGVVSRQVVLNPTSFK